LNVFRDFPNAPRPGTWYPSALANKLAGVRLSQEPDPLDRADIVSFFNGNLGQPGCLDGLSFYLGLDGKAAPDQIDLVTTVLHEFGHGLGFQTFTDDATGRFFNGKPSVWDFNLFDPKQHKAWADMTPGQRARSAISPRNLVWNGEGVTRAAPRVLDRGTPELFVAGAGFNERLMIGLASFGPQIERRNRIHAPMAAVSDQPDGTGLACTPLNAANAKAVKNRVAVIDRGSCAFVDKVKNAQRAGAQAVIIADNAAGSPLPLSGDDATIKIPSVRVSQADGARIKAALEDKAKPWSAPFAVLFENPARLEGADFRGRVYMFTPDPLRPGSSVSHYDVLARPNLLMEPFAEPGQPIAVSAPQDLTLELLRDIGW
jgi:PA domain